MGLLDTLLGWATRRRDALNPRAPDRPAPIRPPAPREAQPPAVADDPAQALATAHRLIDEGNAAEDAGDLDRAQRAYLTAAAHAPALGRAHVNIGNVRLARGDAAGALEAFESALRVQPIYPGAHFNAGNAYRLAGQPELALRAYDQALAQDPDFLQALVARAALLDDLDRLDASAADYALALDRGFDVPEVRADYAHVLARLCRFQDALAECRRVLAQAPTLAKAQGLEAAVLKETGQLDLSIASYERAISVHPESLELASGLLFTLNYRATRADASLVDRARRFGELARARATPWTTWNNDPAPERRLRVGFVSGDFRAHPVAYFLESVLRAIRAMSPRPLELLAYSTDPAADATTHRMRGLFDQWTDIAGLPDAMAGERIRADGVDILIDLSGHTGKSRLSLFAWKPAPVQATWLGYFATTGLREIDHVIVDPISLPPGEECEFVESAWRLPVTRLCFTEPAEDVPVSALPAAAGSGLTFGCFNHLAKIGDEVVSAWASILSSSPGSRLLLKSPPLGDPATREATIARFVRSGVDPAAIITEGLSTRRAYLEAYHRVDIGLDPFPYPGGTTSAESLWMGVPFVTLGGERLLARQGACLLHCLGLDDWIADNPEDYVRVALAKAADLQALAGLREGLRARALASPLFDADQFARHFCEALQGMWRQWCVSRP